MKMQEKWLKNVVMELFINDFDCEEHSSVFNEKKSKKIQTMLTLFLK